MRAGWLPDGEQPHFPLVLGTDGSGYVAKVGSRIRRFKVVKRCMRTALPTRKAVSMPSTWRRG